MSKGMWTKQYAASGKPFYYNATQNISLWSPPPDSVVHEAPNLKTPAEIAEQLRNEEAILSFTSLIPEDTPQVEPNIENQVADLKKSTTSQSTLPIAPYIMDAKAIQDRIHQAVNKSQNESIIKRKLQE